MSEKQKEESFMAEVKLAGVNPYVDVPEGVAKALGGGRKAPVLVKVSAANPKNKGAVPPGKAKLADADQLKAIGRLAPDGWFRTTLVPLRADPMRLYLDTWMRETAGVGVGDTVRVTLQPDRGSRELQLPEQLLVMLAADPKAQAVWDALAPSRRREILTYLNFLKTPEALERNVRKTVIALLEGKDRSGKEKS